MLILFIFCIHFVLFFFFPRFLSFLFSQPVFPVSFPLCTERQYALSVKSTFSDLFFVNVQELFLNDKYE